MDVHHYHLYLIFQNGIIILLSLPDISKWTFNNVRNISAMFIIVVHYHLCLIFLKGILIKILILMILVVYFKDVHLYYLYLIFQNGILIKLLV